MADADARPGVSDLAEIYWAPSQVYARRDGKFGLPLVVFFVVATLLYFVTQDLLQPVMDAEWKVASAKMMRQNPRLTPEAVEQMRGMQKFAVVGIFFFALIGPLLAGLCTWVVGKLFGLKQALAVATTVAVFAFYPMLLEQIVNAAQMLVVSDDSIVSRYSLSLGPARFLGADASPLSRALIGHIDLFTIWTAVLIAIGMRVTAGASKGQAAAVAAIVWVLGALPSLMGAAG